MALVHSVYCGNYRELISRRSPNFKFNSRQSSFQYRKHLHSFTFSLGPSRRRRSWEVNSSEEDFRESSSQPQARLDDGEVNNLGVKAALSMLRFYKREISPLLPNSCRYLPTCSEYSMIAYKKYGVVKGTILTAWRLCRCNPLGGSGYDPPRWFDETTPTEQ